MVLYGCSLCPNDPGANKFDRLLKKGNFKSNWKCSLEYHVQENHPEVEDWMSLQVKVKKGKGPPKPTSGESMDDDGQDTDEEEHMKVVGSAHKTIVGEVLADKNDSDPGPRKRLKLIMHRTPPVTSVQQSGMARSRNSGSKSLPRVSSKASAAATPQILPVRFNGETAKEHTTTPPIDYPIDRAHDGLPDVRRDFELLDTEAWHGGLGEDLQILARNAWPVNDDLPHWDEKEADEASKHLLRYYQAKCEYLEHCLTRSNDTAKTLRADKSTLTNTIAIQNKRSKAKHEGYINYVRTDLEQSVADFSSYDDLIEHLKTRGINGNEVEGVLADVLAMSRSAAEVENVEDDNSAEHAVEIEETADDADVAEKEILDEDEDASKVNEQPDQ